MKPLSEQDRAILAQHAAGASFKEIAEALNVGAGTVRRVVECVGKLHEKGRELLAKDPESLEGLRLTGGVSERVCGAIANATYKVDVPDMERLSDIAAQGRECVARLPKVGPGIMAELDAVLARFGIAWNPRPRPFAWRTKENQHPLMKSWEDDRMRDEQQDNDAQFWNAIVRHVAEIETAVGTGVLENHQGRDSAEGISFRLAFLSGYLEGRGGRTSNMREPEQDDDEYEAAGNLICLPGVKLADVLPSDGGRA